jgi:hypothetical protein
LAATTLALVVPAAQAATAKHVPKHNGTAYGNPVTHRVSRDAKQTGTTRVVLPRIVYITLPAGSPTSAAPIDDCGATMTGCTDQEYCGVRGVNCDQVTGVNDAAVNGAPVADATPPSQAGPGACIEANPGDWQPNVC